MQLFDDVLVDSDNANLLMMSQEVNYHFGQRSDLNNEYDAGAARFAAMIHKSHWTNYESTRKKISSLIPSGYKADHAYINIYQRNIETISHRDSTNPADKTLLIFFGEKWKRSWGGELLFFSDDSDIHQFVEFVPKRVLLFNGITEHWAKSGNSFAECPRYSLAIKLKPNEDIK